MPATNGNKNCAFKNLGEEIIVHTQSIKAETLII
jgi:hypothetical protein